MPSTGTTAIGTNGNAAVTAITFAGDYKTIVIVNTGSVAGFYSLDGGANWNYLTAANGSAPGGIMITNINTPFTSVMIQRIQGGSDLSGIFVSIL